MIPNLHAPARAVALACAAFALAGGATAAPTPTPDAAGPADPHAPVPAVRYDDAIGYRVAPQPQDSPDRTWIQSNATVAAIDAMALTMKGMRHAMPQASPASPSPAPSPAQQAGQAAQHNHGGMTMPAAHHHGEDR